MFVDKMVNENKNVHAERAILRLKEKLMGLEKNAVLSVEGQKENMNSLEEKRLVVKIIQYFRSKILSNELEPEQVESLEVALQCLESTFSLNLADPALQTDVDLLTVFSKEAKNKVPTEDEKALAESLKNEGNELMKNNKFDDAVDKYTQAIRMYPSPTFFCNRLAYSCMGKYIEAREAYKKAVELEPGNESFANNLKIAEEKLKENAGSLGSLPGLGAGFNPLELLNNPTIAQMTQQFMNDPNLQNVFNNLFVGLTGSGSATSQPAGEQDPAASGGGGGNPSQTSETSGTQTTPAPGLNQLLEMGERFTTMMQQRNPDLVEQLRRQFQQNGRPNPNDSNNPPGSS